MGFFASLFGRSDDDVQSVNTEEEAAGTFPDLYNGMTLDLETNEGRPILTGRLSGYSSGDTAITLERLPGGLSFEVREVGSSLTVRGVSESMTQFFLKGTVQESTRLLCRLKELETERAVFYLDSPVSNSGKLRALILDTAREEAIDCQVHLVPNADAVLKETEHVITSDAIILDHCKSWLNPLPGLLSSSLPGLRFVDLTMQGPETGPKTS